MVEKQWTIKQLRTVYQYSDRDIRRKLQGGEIAGSKSFGKWLIPDTEVRRLTGQKKPPNWDGLHGIAARLHDSLSRISPKDWAIWGVPDTGHPPMTSEAGLRIWMDRGILVVNLAVENDERFSALKSKLKTAFPELAQYDSLKRSLAEFFSLCCDLAQEILRRSRDETGLMLSNILVTGSGHLLNVPRFIYDFALDNYQSPKLPELEVLPHDLHKYKLVPKSLPSYILAIGTEDAMVRCKQATESLSNEYVRDGRVREIRDKSAEIKKQIAPFLDALSTVLEQAENVT